MASWRHRSLPEPTRRRISPPGAESRPTGVSLQSFAVDLLGGRIARGELAAGAVVSPERISEEIGVSRSVVRESLRALEALGMIHARPRAGTVVRPVEDWNLLDDRVIRWRNQGPDAARQLRELIVLRAAVEPTAAECATPLLTAADLDGMRTQLGRMEAALDARDGREFVLADATLHATILRASGNVILQQLLTTLEAALQLRYTAFAVFSAASELALGRHRELIAAFAAGDAIGAGAIMRTLIRESQAELWQTEA